MKNLQEKLTRLQELNNKEPFFSNLNKEDKMELLDLAGDLKFNHRESLTRDEYDICDVIIFKADLESISKWQVHK